MMRHWGLKGLKGLQGVRGLKGLQRRTGVARARRSSVALFTSLALTGGALSGCTFSGSLPEDPYSESVESARGSIPLPPEARYARASERPTYVMDETNTAALAPNGADPEEAIPEIYQRGRLVVGVDQSLNLLGFRDATTGELSGFEVALAREIARDIFGDPDAVEFRYVDLNERVSALVNGKVDIVIRTMSMTDSRQQELAFSAPYLTARAGILAGPRSEIQSVEDLNNSTVCVADDSTSEQIARETAPDALLLLVANWADCLVALQQSQADVIIGDDTILAGINDQDPATAIIGRGLSTEQYGVATARGRDNLVRQLNVTMERIRNDGTWQRLYNEWLEPFLPGGTQPEANYVAEDPNSSSAEAGAR